MASPITALELALRYTDKTLKGRLLAATCACAVVQILSIAVIGRFQPLFYREHRFLVPAALAIGFALSVYSYFRVKSRYVAYAQLEVASDGRKMFSFRDSWEFTRLASTTYNLLLSVDGLVRYGALLPLFVYGIHKGLVPLVACVASEVLFWRCLWRPKLAIPVSHQAVPGL